MDEEILLSCCDRRPGSRSTSLIEFSDPDIPEADRLAWVAVRLQLKRGSVVLFVERLADVQRLAFQLEMILHQDAVEQNRDMGRSLQRTVGVEGGRRPHHVIGLPLPGLTTRIRQRNALL